jgi:hypothetical protein
MEVLFWYLIGVLILSVCYYIHLYYNDEYNSKKLMVYKSFKFGLLSWIGIIIGIAFICTGIIFGIDEWIEKKLN